MSTWYQPSNIHKSFTIQLHVYVEQLNVSIIWNRNQSFTRDAQGVLSNLLTWLPASVVLSHNHIRGKSWVQSVLNLKINFWKLEKIRIGALFRLIFFNLSHNALKSIHFYRILRILKNLIHVSCMENLVKKLSTLEQKFGRMKQFFGNSDVRCHSLQFDPQNNKNFMCYSRRLSALKYHPSWSRMENELQ